MTVLTGSPSHPAPVARRRATGTHRRRRAPMSSTSPQPLSGRANRTLALLVTLIAALAAFVVPAGRAHAATGTFVLGATRTDTSGHALQLHGLGIVKVGDTWYGFGEDKTGETSANTSFQDIPCYS